MPVTEEMMMDAREAGIRLEMVGGLPIWEMMPVIKHQKAIDRIRQTLRPTPGGEGNCGCFHYNDIVIRFPEGSQKRPDIAIYCQEPEEEDSEVTLLPNAVIEIISKGYEKKDWEISVPFYQAQGIPDIVVFDPYTNEVTHIRLDGRTTYLSPVALTFACGCQCTV